MSESVIKFKKMNIIPELDWNSLVLFDKNKLEELFSNLVVVERTDDFPPQKQDIMLQRAKNLLIVSNFILKHALTSDDSVISELNLIKDHYDLILKSNDKCRYDAYINSMINEVRRIFDKQTNSYLTILILTLLKGN